jgi:F420-dependent NADP oxidoreductase-like protein
LPGLERLPQERLPLRRKASLADRSPVVSSRLLGFGIPSQAVRIAIIRTGKMGRGFASALSSRHEVVFGSRDPGRASKVVRSTGAAATGPYAETAAGAEVVILAVPWHAMEETLARLGDLSGSVGAQRILCTDRGNEAGPSHDQCGATAGHMSYRSSPEGARTGR